MRIATRSRSYPWIIAVAIGAALLLWSRSTRAQPEIPAEDWSDYEGSYDCRGPCAGPRTLGGHTFVPSTLVEWPFITTRAASTTSVGSAELDIGPRPVAMRFGIDEADDFVYADQTIVASVALASWFSIAVLGQATAVVPTDRSGGVFIGGHGTYGGSAIAALRLVRSGRFQATVLGTFGEQYPNSLVPARIPNNPFEDGNITTVRPALALAYAFTPSLGLQASGSYAWRWVDIVEDDLIRLLAVGAAATLELRSVPLTFLVAGQYSQEFGDESEMMPIENVMFGAGDSRFWGEAGIVYRGREELDLGAALDWKLDDIGDDIRWFAQLRLAYYFL